MSDTNANFGATHDEPSVVMDIDPPDMTTHQPEAIHNQSEGFAPNVADNVMGTPLPDVAANASTTEVHGLVPVSDETTEPVVLPQDTEWIEDHAYQVVTVRAKHDPCLDKAKALAVVLLEHYYPADQGYRVEHAAFPLVQFGGWRTWIYPEDCYTATKRKSDNMKAGVKKNAEPVYETWAGNILADKFHRIFPEHIAGYVALNEVQYEDGSTGWAQHTYLAIMMDDLDTGYAILMLGPRFEFYDYHAKPAWEEKPWEHYLGPNPEDADYDPDLAAEDETSFFSHLGGGDVDSDAWIVDIRSKKPAETLAAVDKLFKSVVGRDVEYRDGYALPGPKI
ncbi:uncharacterized protein CC84DRAFT_1173193 [Paraphaeosphaeria sporulosa]|uniref:Uncharacterized protein n=1 Tax=Paraphaeosphaeria sporulosa TaxID=1460663 RepID=A0A177CTK5_9PLEO|nr:uncharacterized protein CC84DRAFT_1173193 [Paraphaeosphaeria sporulosa]OAG10864.1 hypothetical protein CC84DRAFT_1173193 [Paraphaeosphaeria sporulosa]